MTVRDAGMTVRDAGMTGRGRHTGFKAVSTGLGTQQDNTTTRIPLSHPSPSFPRRRETTGRGRRAPQTVIADLIRNPEGWTKRAGPSYWLQGSIHRTMRQHRPNPENPHNPENPDSDEPPRTRHPVDSRLRGNDGRPFRPPLWIADQVRNDGVTRPGS